MNRSMLFRLIAVVLAVAWLFVILVNYYIVHKPFTGENVVAMLNALGDVLVAGVLFALAAAVGRRATRVMSFASPLEAIVFRAGLGLGLISFATLVLGLAGLLNRLLFWLLLLIVALLLRDDLLATWRDLCAIRLPIASRLERALACFVVVSLVLGFIMTLMPILAWDAQVYHLVAGKIVLAQGRIGPPPDNPPLSYPALVEMLYLAAMTLKGDGATAPIHFGYLLLTLGAVWSFGARYFSARVAWSASALLCAVPSFLLVATWPYNDSALAFYAFVAFYALTLAKGDRALRGFIFAGTFAGFALGEKYTAAVVPLALIILVVRPQRTALKNVVIVTAFAFLTAAPWFLRNWVFMGNPIYPFIFGGPYWDAFRAQHFNPAPDLTRELFALLTAFWNATFFGIQGTTSFDTTIGPLLLMFVPLLVLVWRRGERVVSDTLVFSGVLYLFWLFEMAVSISTRQTRLLFFAFPTLVLLAALAWQRLPEFDFPRFSLARFASWTIGLVLGLTLFAQALDVIAANPLPYLVGMESREEYLRVRLSPPGYYAAMTFIGTLPAPSRVLFLWEPRDYYAEGAAITQSDSILDAFGHLRYQYHDAYGIAHALQRQGFTHLLLNRWGLNFQMTSASPEVSPEDARVLTELLNRYAQQIYGTLPLDFCTDATGKTGVRGAEREAYAIYRFTFPDAGWQP